MNRSSVIALAAGVLATQVLVGHAEDKKCSSGSCSKKVKATAKANAENSQKEASCSKKESSQEASCSKKETSCSKKEASCSKKE